MTIGQKQFAVEQRRADVAARYLRGEMQSQIAASYGLSRQQITADLATIRAAWLASAVRDFDAAKAEELAKVDEVERAAWDGWARSQQPKEVTHQEDRDGKRKASLRKEGQAGNPAFLQVVLTCIDKRCAILGLDAPKRFIISEEQWAALTPEQIDQLARGVSPDKVLTA